MAQRVKKAKGDQALAVAVCVVTHEKSVLFIERKGNFEGMLALPGGKIHGNEHAKAAAVREIKEETGFDISEPKFLGTVSELYASQKGTQHFLLEVFTASTSAKKHTHGEFTPIWLPITEIPKRQKDIIPSDYLMLTRLFMKKEGGYFDCELREITGKGVVLKKFEKAD